MNDKRFRVSSNKRLTGSISLLTYRIMIICVIPLSCGVL